jgi:hypothetical protein
VKNVEMRVEGDRLTIEIDLSKEYGPSSSGKTIIIASTEGNVSIADREEQIGLNVYRKKLCVASSTSGHKVAEEMRDFALLQDVCRRSEAHERRRTSTIHGGAEA